MNGRQRHLSSTKAQKFKVMVRHKDNSIQEFASKDTYEEAEKHLLEMPSVAEEYWIPRVWVDVKEKSDE